MNTSVSFPPPHPKAEPVLSGSRYVLAGAGITLGLWFLAQDGSANRSLLFAIGLGLGAALYFGAFGFAAAYRNAFVRRDVSGILAQIVMIGLATILFAPVLAQGQAGGAWAPIGVQVAAGSFLFGVGMQIGGACASGTLFSIGGGNLRMILTLLFFCLGAFLGSLHLHWWAQLPDWGTQSLGHLLGWPGAVIFQIGVLVILFIWVRQKGRGYPQTGVWQAGLSFKSFMTGPWPFLLSAIVLALLNWATLLVADHPWTVTWAFTLWGAKLMQVVGWDATTNLFWTSPFQVQALENSIWADTTSLMNIAVLVGAFTAAFVANRLCFRFDLSFKSFAASLIGGLLMGYGARLAYGCNIGALFSGMASTSLHAWLWLVCAMVGTVVGVWLRPIFGLSR